MNASFLPPQAGPLLTRHLKMGGANPTGIRLDLTNRYLTRAGQPFLPVMGSSTFPAAKPKPGRPNLPR